MLATIYDVAEKAGVSPKTVSRVLNRDAPVNEKTRARVQDAMDALGYVPSLAARSIKSQKSGLIGLITGAISTVPNSPTQAGLPELYIVQGIQSVIERSRMTLLISDTGGRLDRVPALIETFRQHRVEGLLYVSDHHQVLDQAIETGATPTVLANCLDGHGTPAILPDDEAGQKALTEHLIGLGHRRIGYLTLAAAMEATRLRLAGYRSALKAAGIGYDPDLVLPVDMFGDPGEHQLLWDGLDRFLKLDTPPSVICCGNDRLAMAVYGILRERGVSIPDDISIAGYDDHRLISETLYPMLTTVDLAYNAIGARAAQLLLDLVAGEAVPETPVRVGGPVVVRNSVRPATSHPKIIQLKGRKQS